MCPLHTSQRSQVFFLAAALVRRSLSVDAEGTSITRIDILELSAIT